MAANNLPSFIRVIFEFGKHFLFDKIQLILDNMSNKN